MPTSPLPPDPYKILGVAKDAPLATVRSAHRKLVLLSHPDKFPDEAVKAQKAEEFQRVQQAYEILSDEKNRERYDAQVRLAELKAERFREEANSPKRHDPPYSPRPSAERVWTTQPIFEEIRPKHRHYDDAPPSSSRTESRYEEPRSRYDDYGDFVPAHGVNKKAGSSRIAETRPEDTSSRRRNPFKAAANAARVTAAFTKTTSSREYEESRRTRDKSRRDDGQSKRQHNRTSFEGDSESEMEPDVISFMKHPYSGHKKESSRSYEDDRHHRRKYESRPSSPDHHEAKTNMKVHSAAEYIAKSKSSVGHSQSVNQVPPPPPPAPPAPPVEDVVRSSARRNGISKSTKSSKRDPPEIVEPRYRDYDSNAKIPELKTTLTSPTGLKAPLRSATMDVHGSEPARHSMRRSATSPLTPSASHSQKSSKLGRDMHDPEYSSPGDNQTSRTKVYKVRPPSDSESDNAGPRVVLLDPEHRRPQATRESSSYGGSHRSERLASSGKSTRHAAGRSHTEEHISHTQRPATLSRGATDRPGMLYAEIPRSSPEPRLQYQNIQESRRYNRDDIHFAATQRRPSADNDHGHGYGRSSRAIPLRSGLSAKG